MAVHLVETAVGKVPYLFSLAKPGAVFEVVSGDHGIVEVIIKILQYLVHPFVPLFIRYKLMDSRRKSSQLPKQVDLQSRR